MFDKIQNPATGKWVNTNGPVGRKVLNNYVRQAGGALTLQDGHTEALRYANIIASNLSNLSNKKQKVTAGTVIRLGLATPLMLEASKRKSSATKLTDSIIKIQALRRGRSGRSAAELKAVHKVMDDLIQKVAAGEDGYETAEDGY